ncbi:hypothetical protein F5Y15DRAFT_419668 [Xylariaceae sp. FL0016]|nr:hypothetical protein F5Y15DRAFT_419668 [Xylariaceae sp. FL0016]
MSDTNVNASEPAATVVDTTKVDPSGSVAASVETSDVDGAQGETKSNPNTEDDQVMGDAATDTEAKVETKTEPQAKAGTEPKAEESEKNSSNGATKEERVRHFRHPPKGMLKVHGKGTEDLSIEEEDSDDPVAIRKQVEFYMSNCNLLDDKFMREKVGGKENKAVPLKLISSFKRMRHFKPYSAVVAAVKDSDCLIVEGADGEETIQRKEPMVFYTRQERDERSIYVKGFGPGFNHLQPAIEAFFAQFGNFDAVRLRRAGKDSDNLFKGSVFVEWPDKESAQKFYDLDPEPTWKDHPLHILWKTHYDEEHAKEEAEKEAKGLHKFKSHRGQRRDRGHGNSRGNDRGDKSDDWRARRQRDQENGFDGDRRQNNRGSHGRGRGRGRGRGNFRGRGGRREEGEGRHEDESKPESNGRPKINVSKEGQKALDEHKAQESQQSATNGKRARDEDGDGAEPPAKKIDTKEGA